ncbi:DUF6233 domain-containing protein [Streptomyces sp. Ru62]|uniref:DUF6233 domain-containing protein n=1 Tax=Streptomyces sp. Ru62 TaxID=2080745 RepID=UPI0035BC7B23
MPQVHPAGTTFVPSLGPPPVRVHRGTCYMAGKRHRPVGPDEARRLLADGTCACSHCRPDTALGIAGFTAANRIGLAG